MNSLEYLAKMLAIPKATEKHCYEMGYDCEMNGADEKNCHFSLFSSPENTKAWESGKEKARLTKRALDGAICPDCHEPLVNGACPALHALQDTPRK